MSRRQLSNPLGNHVDKHLLAGNHFKGFFEKMAGHKAERHGTAEKREWDFGGH
jgi:hypothetical protein